MKRKQTFRIIIVLLVVSFAFMLSFPHLFKRQILESHMAISLPENARITDFRQIWSNSYIKVEMDNAAFYYYEDMLDEKDYGYYHNASDLISYMQSAPVTKLSTFDILDSKKTIACSYSKIYTRPEEQVLIILRNDDTCVMYVIRNY